MITQLTAGERYLLSNSSQSTIPSSLYHEKLPGVAEGPCTPVTSMGCNQVKCYYTLRLDSYGLDFKTNPELADWLLPELVFPAKNIPSIEIRFVILLSLLSSDDHELESEKRTVSVSIHRSSNLFSGDLIVMNTEGLSQVWLSVLCSKRKTVRQLQFFSCSNAGGWKKYFHFEIFELKFWCFRSDDA